MRKYIANEVRYAKSAIITSHPACASGRIVYVKHPKKTKKNLSGIKIKKSPIGDIRKENTRVHWLNITYPIGNQGKELKAGLYFATIQRFFLNQYTSGCFKGVFLETLKALSNTAMYNKYTEQK